MLKKEISKSWCWWGYIPAPVRFCRGAFVARHRSSAFLFVIVHEAIASVAAFPTLHAAAPTVSKFPTFFRVSMHCGQGHSKLFLAFSSQMKCFVMYEVILSLLCGGGLQCNAMRYCWLHPPMNVCHSIILDSAAWVWNAEFLFWDSYLVVLYWWDGWCELLFIATIVLSCIFNWRSHAFYFAHLTPCTSHSPHTNSSSCGGRGLWMKVASFEIGVISLWMFYFNG